MSGPVKGLLAPGLMEQPQPRGLLDMLYPQGWRGGLFGMGNPTGAYLDQRELSRPGVNPGASPMSNRDLARQYAINIGSGMGTDAGPIGSIKMTPAESTFFSKVINHPVEREQIMEMVPSLKIEGNNISIAPEHIRNFMEYIDNITMLREGERLPPSFYHNQITKKLSGNGQP